jgi:palmitoyltransferase
VGHYNQRHFVIFCIYSIMAPTLGAYVQLSYLHLSLPLPEMLATYIPPLPLFQLLAGNITLGSFLLLLHLYACFFFIVVAGGLLCWQLLIIVTGQTSYEAWKMIKVYDEGVLKNILNVFGSLKYAWILPFAPLRLPMENDGCKYEPKRGMGKE